MPDESRIDQYISDAPQEAQTNLRELRAILKQIVKQIAPETKETIKWGRLAFEERRILFTIAPHKTHINFMPTRTALEPFKEELKDYKTGMDTIQLPYGKPLPVDLIQRIAEYRVKEVLNEGSLWMHKTDRRGS